MMKLYNYIYQFLAALMFGLLAFSCSGDEPVTEYSDTQDVTFKVAISDAVSVGVGSRAGDEDESTIFDRFPVGVDFVEGRSLIRVCSVDRSNGHDDRYLPDYDNPYTDLDNPTRYHEYKCVTRRDYEKYSDFAVCDDAISLQWDKIDETTGNRVNGTGNILYTNTDGGFYLFAAMYPYTYERPVARERQLLIVKDDQTYDPVMGTKYDNFAASLLINDIRLCQKFFGYDHFRKAIELDFYHSLCMLVVNVKVPIYQEFDGLGFKTDDIAKAWPPKMWLENVGRAYAPRYEIAYDKDAAVSVEAEMSVLDNIAMFQTPNFKKPDVKKGFDPVNDSYIFDEEDYQGVNVPVMWMQFCAILPFQQLTDVNTDANIHFNIAGKDYRCYFSKINEPVKLEQGHVTIVSMYIPRGDSDPVLVGARLKDWQRKRTPIVSLQ